MQCAAVKKSEKEIFNKHISCTSRWCGKKENLLNIQRVSCVYLLSDYHYPAINRWSSAGVHFKCIIALSLIRFPTAISFLFLLSFEMNCDAVDFRTVNDTTSLFVPNWNIDGTRMQFSLFVLNTKWISYLRRCSTWARNEENLIFVANRQMMWKLGRSQCDGIFNRYRRIGTNK